MTIWYSSWDNTIIGPIEVIAQDAEAYYIDCPDYKGALKAIPKLLVSSKIELDNEVIPLIYDYILGLQDNIVIDFSYVKTIENEC